MKWSRHKFSQHWFPGASAPSRVREAFAWLPVETSNGVTIWLERYLRSENYRGGRWVLEKAYIR